MCPDDSPHQPPPDPELTQPIGRDLPLEQVGPYRLLRKIGEGGMGRVFLAEDTVLKRRVALKFLSDDLSGSAEARRRLVHEARAAAALDHPFICKTYETGEYGGAPFIAMEYVEGQTLQQRLTQGPIRLDEGLGAALEIADALQYAHTHGIIHRDLKPANIMMTPDGHVKVMDFGLAKHVPTAHSDTAETLSTLATATGNTPGTPAYMSPEQVLGQPLDARSDIFAFGVILYEMLAGVHPFKKNSAVSTLNAILSDAPLPIDQSRREVPEVVARSLDRMLAKNRDARQPEMTAVRADLKWALENRRPGTGVRRAGRLRPWPRRRPLVLGLSTGTVVVAAVVLFLLVSNRPALSFAARDWILVTNVENTTGDPVFDKSLDNAFRVALEQSMYVNVFSLARVTDALKRMRKQDLATIDAAVGRDICEREGIRGLVVPAIAQVGRRYSVTTRLIDPVTGDPVRSYSAEADNRDEVLTAIDKVTTRLRRDLGESLREVKQSSMPLLQATTPSIQALKDHAEARVLQQKNDYKGAVRLFEEALKLDPDFALAHAGAGGAYMSFVFNDQIRGRQHLELAMKLRDRATERERLIIELNYRSSFGNPDDTIRVYQEYLAKWPDDPRQRYNFAGALRESDRVPEAIEQYKYAIKINPTDASSHVNLATCYHEQGRFKEAVASWEDAFKLQPTWIVNGNLNHEYGLALIANGNIAKAREVYDQAIKDKNLQSAGLRSTGLLDLYEGKYRSAEGRFREAIVLNKAAKSSLSEARNHLFLAMTLAGLGDRAGAVKELDAGFKVRNPKSPQAWLWGRIAVMYASFRMLPKAQELLAVARAETATDIPSQIAALHWAEGEVELAKGPSAGVLEKIQVADKEGHSALTQETLARVYRATGDTARAIFAYQALVDGLKATCLGWEAQVPCVAAKYELATLYRADKRPDKARQQLDELLAQWQGADVELPLLKNAKTLREQLDKEQGQPPGL